MHKRMLVLAATAVVMVVAGCEKKNFDAVTGTTDYTSVTITPTTANLHVRLIPRVITIDTATLKADTVPAHDVPVDSALLAVSIQPQNVVIANAVTNSDDSFSAPKIVELTDASYFVPDTTGTVTFTRTYTDVNHDFATTTQVIPITVTQVP
jgi:hypothetical protein